MVENVINRKLYQVTVTTPYKQAFVEGQKLKVGQDYTPFFRFYETTLQYPVTDGNTGSVVQVNAVEWLHRVRIGTIQTSPEILANIAWEVSQHYMMLARELLLEQIRLEEFGGKPPSRQRCLYLSETVEEARSWLPLLGGNGAVCELVCTGNIQKADSRLMVKVSEPLSVTREKAQAYWRGEASADPRFEILFVGDARVTGLGL
jgi:hypothetical protein